LAYVFLVGPKLYISKRYKYVNFYRFGDTIVCEIQKTGSIIIANLKNLPAHCKSVKTIVTEQIKPTCLY